MRKIDIPEAREFAKQLARTKSNAERMVMQQAYVAKINKRYNSRELGAKYLTEVWRLVAHLEKEQGEEETYA